MTPSKSKSSLLSPAAFTSCFLGFITLYHLLLAPFFPLGVDDGHYALYGLMPDLSYFDHPPVTGWLMALFVEPGSSEMMVRLPSLLSILLTSILLYHITPRLFPESSKWSGTVSVVLFNSAPLVQYLGWSMVPDMPLMPLTLLFLMAGWQVHKRGHIVDWCLLGLIAGLCGLTKYTSVLFPVAFVIIMICYQRLSWLASAGPWLAAIIALATISPVIIWNYQHDWVSFAYQFGHSTGKGWRLSQGLSIEVLQLLVYGPILFIGAIVATLAYLRKQTHRRFEHSLLLTMGWIVLLATLWAAGNGDMMVHWSLTGWAVLTPIISVWLLNNWHKRNVRILSWVSAGWSVFLILFISVMLTWMPLSLAPALAPAVKDLVGWKEAAQRAQKLAETQPEAAARQLLVSNWSHASRIAWYAWPTPVQVFSSRKNQFDLWYGEPDSTTQGILIYNSKKPEKALPESLNESGLHCSLKEDQTAVADGVEISRFGLYLCQPSASTKTP